jgi:DNA-binding NarL/FixJ family response regulator
MKNILILTDNTLSQDYLKDSLAEDHEVEPCASINEAIYKLMNQRVDLVISDRSIGIQSSSPFLKLIKDLYPHIKVLLLNDNESKPSVNSASGISSKVEIKQVVRQLLDGRCSNNFVSAAS